MCWHVYTVQGCAFFTLNYLILYLNHFFKKRDVWNMLFSKKGKVNRMNPSVVLLFMCRGVNMQVYYVFAILWLNVAVLMVQNLYGFPVSLIYQYIVVIIEVLCSNSFEAWCVAVFSFLSYQAMSVLVFRTTFSGSLCV